MPDNLHRPIALIARIYNLRLSLTEAQNAQFKEAFKPQLERFRAGEMTWSEIFEVVDRLEALVKHSSTETMPHGSDSKPHTRS